MPACCRTPSNFSELPTGACGWNAASGNAGPGAGWTGMAEALLTTSKQRSSSGWHMGPGKPSECMPVEDLSQVEGRNVSSCEWRDRGWASHSEGGLSWTAEGSTEHTEEMQAQPNFWSGKKKIFKIMLKLWRKETEYRKKGTYFSQGEICLQRKKDGVLSYRHRTEIRGF